MWIAEVSKYYKPIISSELILLYFNITLKLNDWYFRQSFNMHVINAMLVILLKHLYKYHTLLLNWYEKLCRKNINWFSKKRSVERYQISTKCQRANLLVSATILYYHGVDYSLPSMKFGQQKMKILFWQGKKVI